MYTTNVPTSDLQHLCKDPLSVPCQNWFGLEEDSICFNVEVFLQIPMLFVLDLVV